MAEPTAPAKKSKPIPPLYYGIGAAVLAVGFLLYRRSSTSKSAAAAQQAATAQTASMTPVAAGSYGNANDISSLLPYLNAAGNAGTSTTSGVTSGPQVGAMSGSGFLPSGLTTASIGTNPGTYTANDQQGGTYTWANPAEYAALPPGTATYYGPLPGVFSTTRAGLAGNTPIYVKST